MGLLDLALEGDELRRHPMDLGLYLVAELQFMLFIGFDGHFLDGLDDGVDLALGPFGFCLKEREFLEFLHDIEILGLNECLRF